MLLLHPHIYIGTKQNKRGERNKKKTITEIKIYFLVNLIARPRTLCKCIICTSQCSMYINTFVHYMKKTTRSQSINNNPYDIVLCIRIEKSVQLYKIQQYITVNDIKLSL